MVAEGLIREEQPGEGGAGVGQHEQREDNRGDHGADERRVPAAGQAKQAGAEAYEGEHVHADHELRGVQRLPEGHQAREDHAQKAQIERQHRPPLRAFSRHGLSPPSA